MGERTLLVRFVGDTASLAASAGEVSSQLGGIGKTAIAIGTAVVAGLGAAGGALYSIGGTFDDLSDTIRTGTGKSGAALDGLLADAKAIGTQVPANFADVGTAVTDLNKRLGLTGEPLQQLSGQILNLSRITKTDLGENIANITRVFGDWGISVDQQAGALDKIYRASQATGASINMLSENVVKFGAPLRQLGFTFEQSLAILGKFEKEGVNTELVLGAMRKALGKMAKEGEEPISTFKRIAQEIKNAGDAGQANKIALELFGAKAGPDMAAAIREGRFSIEELVSTISGGGDTINKAAAETADFAEQWQLLKNKVMVALEPIATRVFGLVGEKVTELTGIFERNMPAIQTAVAVAGVVLGYVVDAIGILIVAAVRLIGILTEVVGFVSAHWRPIMLAMIPIILLFGPHFVALGIAATVNMAKVAAAWVVAQLGAIRAAAVHSIQIGIMIGRWVVLAVVATANAIRVAAAWVITQVAALAGVAIGIAAIVALIARFAWMGVQALLHAAKVAAAWVIALGPVGWVIAAVIALVALIIANWDTVVSWTRQAWDWVVEKIVSASDWIKSAVSAAVDFVVNFVRDHWQLLLAIIGGPLGIIIGLVISNWDRITSVFRAGVDTVLAIWGWLSQLPGRIAGWFGSVVSAAADKIGQLIGWVQGIPGRILGALGDLGNLLFGAGQRVIQSMINGIMSMIGAVGRAIGSVASKVTNALPFSPAKEGPLRRHPPEVAGRRIVELLAGGMLGRIQRVVGAVRKVAATVADVMPDQGQGLADRLLGTGYRGRVREALTLPPGVLATVTSGAADGELAGVREEIAALVDALVDGLRAEVNWRGLTLQVNKINRGNARR